MNEKNKQIEELKLKQNKNYQIIEFQ